MPAYICHLDKDFQKHAVSNLIYKLTVNYNVLNIHAYNLYTENWKTYDSQQKMIDKLCKMFKVFNIFTFYLCEEELNKSIVFLTENIKNQLLDNKLAKWLPAIAEPAHESLYKVDRIRCVQQKNIQSLSLMQNFSFTASPSTLLFMESEFFKKTKSINKILTHSTISQSISLDAWSYLMLMIAAILDFLIFRRWTLSICVYSLVISCHSILTLFLMMQLMTDQLLLLIHYLLLLTAMSFWYSLGSEIRLKKTENILILLYTLLTCQNWHLLTLH